jgi:prepilin-type processing-associated H-X9-DG protein
MMGTNVGIAPFDDPMPSKTMVDRWGQAGNRQDYASKVYVCTSVPEWTDERNGSYGYNYQHLGNSRVYDTSDPTSFKNWPVMVTKVRDTGRCVAVGDTMGTAANFAAGQRHPYQNNVNDEHAYGNEGFNLDPPRIDTANGEAASGDVRSGADPRHLGRVNILFVDGHGSAETLEALGYKLSPDGSFDDDGNNARWSLSGKDEPWLRSQP